MSKLLTEIESEFYEFVQKEIDAKELFDISIYGNPNTKPADKTTWINVTKEKGRLIAEYKKIYGERLLKQKLENIINPLSSWF